jgi:hypothetical protein
MANRISRNALRKQMDRLTSLTASIKTVDPSDRIWYSQERSWPCCGVKSLFLSSFDDLDELESTLLRLSQMEQMSEGDRADALQANQEKKDYWWRLHKEKSYSAKWFDFESGSPDHLRLMRETDEAYRNNVSLHCVDIWIRYVGVLPEDVGIVDLDRHSPYRSKNDSTTCAIFNWVLGEFRISGIYRFHETVESYALAPDHHYVVETRSHYTMEGVDAWKAVIQKQIRPMMERIKQAGGPVTADGRALIAEVKSVIEPWAFVRPWPPLTKKKRRPGQMNLF